MEAERRGKKKAAKKKITGCLLTAAFSCGTTCMMECSHGGQTEANHSLRGVMMRLIHSVFQEGRE